MDPWVLKGQEWVNDMYRDVPGYQVCEEDGATGWKYVNSLIMGLQHELGISPVVASFGPNTLTQLQQKIGDIGTHTTNMNVCELVRFALFAKGYWGGEAPLQISSQTADGIKALNEDMGIAGFVADPYQLVPRATKALFNTDPYKFDIDSATPEQVQIWEAQKWINGRYFLKKYYAMSPCNGVYSRSMQKSLLVAIQIACGISEDLADGLWGSGTKYAISQNTVKNGDYGTVVQLFHAAGVCNVGFLDEDGDRPTLGFRGTFTADTEAWVRKFQEFSGFGLQADDGYHQNSTVNGIGDINTWAQLLVSQGNSSRDATGCDCITTITPERGAALYDWGYRSVGRYLHEESDIPPEYQLNKEIQPGELQDIFAAGLRCFPIWQYANNSIDDFYFEAGENHGRLAHEHADYHGFNAGTCIYFAVDYDALDSEISTNIIPYFRGINAALKTAGSKYVPGIYGSRNPCSRVSDAGLAKWSFVSGMSWGYSGNLGFPLPQNWAYNQIREYDFPGASAPFGLDHDVHRVGADQGVNSVSSGTLPIGEYGAYLLGIHEEVNSRGYVDPVVGAPIVQQTRNLMVEAFVAGRTQDLVDRGDLNEWIYRDWHEYSQLNLRDGLKAEFTDKDGVRISARKFFGIEDWRYDLASLYGSWRRHRNTYPNGADFCALYMGSDTLTTGFTGKDFIADISHEYFLMMKYSDGEGNWEKPTHEAFSQMAPQGTFSKANVFCHRLGGDVETIVATARPVLTEPTEELLTAMRLHAGSGGVDVLPADLSIEDRSAFLTGFATYVVEQA